MLLNRKKHKDIAKPAKVYCCNSKLCALDATTLHYLLLVAYKIDNKPVPGIVEALTCILDED